MQRYSYFPDLQYRVAAATAKKELNLVCLQRDMNESYLDELSDLVKERGLAAGNANLQMSLRLGVLPFIQDWFAGDTNVTRKAAIFGVPDFWYMAHVQNEHCILGRVLDILQLL